MKNNLNKKKLLLFKKKKKLIGRDPIGSTRIQSDPTRYSTRSGTKPDLGKWWGKETEGKWEERKGEGKGERKRRLVRGEVGRPVTEQERHRRRCRKERRNEAAVRWGGDRSCLGQIWAARRRLHQSRTTAAPIVGGGSRSRGEPVDCWPPATFLLWRYKTGLNRFEPVQTGQKKNPEKKNRIYKNKNNK